MPTLVASTGNNGDGRDASGTGAPPRADLLGALARAAMAQALDESKKEQELKDPVTPPLLKSEARPSAHLSIEEEKKNYYPSSAPYLPRNTHPPRVSEVGIYSGYPSYRPGFYPPPQYSHEHPPFWSSYASAYGHPHAIPPYSSSPSYHHKQTPDGIRRASIPHNGNEVVNSDSSEGEPCTEPKYKVVSPPVASAPHPDSPAREISSDLTLTRSKASGRSKQASATAHASKPTPNKRRASMGKWSEDEDELLRRAVKEFGGKNWKKIASRLKGRTDVQCLHRWQKVLRPGLVKGPWTAEEDHIVVDFVKKNGTKKWSHIARQLNGRLGKQCRERWYVCAAMAL